MKNIKTILLLLAIPALAGCNWLSNQKTQYHFLTMYPEIVYLEVGQSEDMAVNYSFYDSEDPGHSVTLDDFVLKSTDEKVAVFAFADREVEYEGKMYPTKVPVVTAVGPGECAISVAVDNQLTYSIVSVVESEPSGEGGDEEGEENTEE